MAAFELNDRRNRTDDEDVLGVQSNCETLDARRLREECIIALKVYDSCRQQN